jgi:1,4-dihydroxy-2-naphthoate polyprenyltransferase
MKRWISAFRIRTLPLSVAGIVVASLLAKSKGFFDVTIFILALLSAMALQVLSNLGNDYGDGLKGTDNDKRIGPKRAIQTGSISPESMKKALYINVLVVILLVLALFFSAFGWEKWKYILLFAAMSIFAIWAALKYTVGDSPYGYKGLGDIFVFFFFGPGGVLSAYFLYTHHLDWYPVLPAISLGLFSAAVLNLNNMRDIENDTSSGKITLAVKLGKQNSKKYHYFVLVTAILLTVLFVLVHYEKQIHLLAILALLPIVFHVFKLDKIKDQRDFDPQLKILALGTFVFALVLGISRIL